MKESPDINKLTRILKYWFPPLLWAILIFTFSSSPTGKVGPNYWFDFSVKKIVHVVEYGFFALLMYRGLINGGIGRRNSGYWAIFLSFLYGATDEFHQSFTPGREPTLRDVIFDTIGAVLAIYFIWKWLHKMPKRLKIWAKRLEIN